MSLFHLLLHGQRGKPSLVLSLLLFSCTSSTTGLLVGAHLHVLCCIVLALEQPGPCLLAHYPLSFAAINDSFTEAIISCATQHVTHAMRGVLLAGCRTICKKHGLVICTTLKFGSAAGMCTSPATR